MGRVYVRFALANPALFRLMMVNARDGAVFDWQSDQVSGLNLLRRNIAELATPDTSAHIQRIRAVQSWAMVHGLAMLILDGQVPPDDMLIDSVVSTAAMHGKD